MTLTLRDGSTVDPDDPEQFEDEDEWHRFIADEMPAEQYAAWVGRMDEPDFSVPPHQSRLRERLRARTMRRFA